MSDQAESAGRELRRRLAAELVYDTGTQSLPRGLRAVGRRARCIFFTADDFEVMLEVLPEQSPDRRSLIGSVMREGLPLAGAVVRLDGPARPASCETNLDGGFRWSGLSRDEYALEIDDSAHTLVLPPLSLAVA